MRAPTHAYSYARLKRLKNTYARRPKKLPHMRPGWETSRGTTHGTPRHTIPKRYILFFTDVEHTFTSVTELKYARHPPQSQMGIQLMRDGPTTYARRT